MLLAGIQANFGLDPRLKHSGVTTWEVIRGPPDTQQLAAGLFTLNRPKRILLYGFGPYRPFHENITAKIVKALPPQPGLRRVVFPVRFHRKQFVNALDRFRPDIVLGLGQSSRRRIDIELQAANRRRGRRTAKPRPISPRGPKRLKTTLKMTPAGPQAGRSANAGEYVCNFSMYVMLEHIQRNELDIPYGFIHIPHDCEQKKAAGLIEKILRRCQRVSLNAQR
jgi:pyroglutamyl-peptidase